MFAFAGALALAFSFMFMFVLQAATPKTSVATAAGNSISFVFIFASSSHKGNKGMNRQHHRLLAIRSPRSSTASPTLRRALPTFSWTFPSTLSFVPRCRRLGIARQLTKFFFRGAFHLLAFPFKFVFVSHCFPCSLINLSVTSRSVTD